MKVFSFGYDFPTSVTENQRTLSWLSYWAEEKKQWEHAGRAHSYLRGESEAGNSKNNPDNVSKTVPERVSRVKVTSFFL